MRLQGMRLSCAVPLSDPAADLVVLSLERCKDILCRHSESPGAASRRRLEARLHAFP